MLFVVCETSTVMQFLKHPDLTLQKTIEIATPEESAKKDQQLLAGEEEVCAVRSTGGRGASSPRPRAAMASTLPDSTSQLTSHLRQVSWGMIEQNCFERKQILSDCKRSRKVNFFDRHLEYLSLWLRARPKAERVLLRIRENPEYERPAGRPWSRF